MIELDLVYGDEPETDRGELWSNTEQTHVISEEDGRFHIRDEAGDLGSYPTLADAFDYLMDSQVWGEVTLAPANRLRHNIDVEDECDGMQYLTQYLATYGTAGIDAQALARRVFERLEES